MAQLGVADMDGLGTLLMLVKRSADLARNRRSGGDVVQADGDSCTANNDTTRLALWVLINLASNHQLSPRISASLGCIGDLVVLMVREWGEKSGNLYHYMKTIHIYAHWIDLPLTSCAGLRGQTVFCVCYSMLDQPDPSQLQSFTRSHSGDAVLSGGMHDDSREISGSRHTYCSTITH